MSPLYSSFETSRRSVNCLLLASGLAASKAPRLQAAASALALKIDREHIQGNFDYLVRRALETRTLPMLQHFALTSDWIWNSELEGLSKVIAAAQRTLLAESGCLLRAFTKAQISYALIKGVDYIYSIYPMELDRHMVDIDVLIKPPAMDAARHIATSQQFFQGVFNPNTLQYTAIPASDLKQITENHYELPPFLKLTERRDLLPYRDLINQYLLPRENVLTAGNTIFVLSEIDVHFNLSADIDLDHIWANPRSLAAFEETCEALSWEVHIWFLAGRLYAEANERHRSTLRLLIDLAAILCLHNQSINWTKIRHLGETYGMMAPFYYVFSILHDLDPWLVPSPFLEECFKAVVRDDERGRDRGDILPVLLDCPMRHCIQK